MDYYSVFDCLEGRAVALKGLSTFEGDLALTLWSRNENSRTVYAAPNHHTLSLYLAGGRGIRRRLGKRMIAGGEPGKLCIMPAGIDSDWDVCGSVEMLHLYFTDRDIERLLHPRSLPLPKVRSGTFVKNPSIEAVMRALFLHLDWDDDIDRLAISHAALSVIALLLRDNIPVSRRVNGGLPAKALAIVKDYIDAHLDGELRLTELAAVAGLSPFHFSRVFHQSTGETVHRYVIRLRLERAATLISGGDVALAEVAIASGFSSQSHLARRFRQHFGVNPASYAARNRRGVESASGSSRN